MVKLRKPAPTAVALTVLGVVTMGMDLVWEPQFILGAYGIQPVPIVGAIFFGLGFVMMTATLKPRDQSPVTIPAHVAFMGRTARADPLVAAAPTPAAAPSTPTKRDSAIARLDEQIRELTRDISRAGVMRATGKLSDDGYLHYVDRLKKKRADLEGARVEHELET